MQPKDQQVDVIEQQLRDELPEPVDQGAEEPVLIGQIARARFKSWHNHDVINVRTWDGQTEGGADIKAGLTPRLRKTGNTTDMTYPMSADGTRTYKSGDPAEEAQAISPPFSVDDELFIFRPIGGAGVQDDNEKNVGYAMLPDERDWYDEDS